jgi:3-oxoacyl-(acyl-carrier-protein) synthase
MDAKAARRSESSLHFGVAAAKQALADSGFELTDENRTEVGVVFGSGAGGQQLMIDNYVGLTSRGNRTVAPTFIANALVDSCSGMIAIETGAIGHNVCMVSACATGTHNVGEAAEAIRRGDCIAVISGSTEAPLLEVAHAGFSNMRGMGLPRPGEPLETVSRPFDATRDGFVLGEGSGSLFLEDLEVAKARGAHIYAEVVGYGSAADGWDMVQPIDAGVGSARAMQMALERRGVPADEVDLINPHGTSTPLGDKREAEALHTVFGPRAARDARSLAISATKSMTGHMMGAAGAFEAFATVMSVAEQCVPGTLNFRDIDPECDLWVESETHAFPIRYALSNNIGLGGHNGAVIFRRYDGD